MIEALIEKCRSARANGDPNKYIAFITVAEAHEIARLLAAYQAKGGEVVATVAENATVGEPAVYAHPKPDGIGVKPLQWADPDNYASTPFGAYTVTEGGDDDLWHWTFHCYPYGDPDETGYSSMNDAKAAAQADYEARIRSALTSPASGERDAVTPAAADVLAERKRQVEVEGWMPGHDDGHERGEIAYAAACYALSTRLGRAGWLEQIVERLWPWSTNWWKPATPRRNLVKAGALILAEIERLDRAALRMEGK